MALIVQNIIYFSVDKDCSGVYIFRFTSRYCNNCFDVVPVNDRCLAFPFSKALLKLYILNLLGMLSLKINIISCSVSFLLMRHYKIYHLKILVLWKMWFDFLDGYKDWRVTSWRVREMTAFIVPRVFGACVWLHYTLRKTLFQPMLNSVYNRLVLGHLKMSSPRKCQF